MKNIFAYILIALINIPIVYSQYRFSNIDIHPTGNSYASILGKLNNKLILLAQDENEDYQLWTSDGTSAGTQLLKKINPTGSTDCIGNPTIFNNKLYLSLRTDTEGYELWVTDGTPAGTQLVADINPGSSSSYIYFYSIINNKLIFSATTATNGEELWVTDGTTAGTQLLKDINPGTGSSSSFIYHTIGNKLYFSANDNSNGYELWVTDRTTAGTQLLKDINVGPASSEISKMVSLNNKLYFLAYTPTYGTEIWVSDGTTAGTTLLKDLNPNQSIEDISNLTNYNNKLYIRSNLNLAFGTELYSINLADTSFQLVKDINPGNIGSMFRYVNIANDLMYFMANTAAEGEEIWTSDGTNAGTYLLKDISPGTSSSDLQNVVGFKGKTIIVGIDSIFNSKLYVHDKVTKTTTLIQPDIAPKHNPLGNSTTYFSELNDKLYFGADYNTIGSELWYIEDTTSTSTKEIPFNNNWSVYPNPANEYLDIQGIPEKSTIRIYNIVGQYQIQTLKSTQSQRINIEQLKAGNYLVVITTPEGLTASKQFVKQ